MFRAAGFLLASAFLSLSFCLSPAQQVTYPSPRRLVVVNVLYPPKPVHDLAKENFRIWIDKDPVVVLDARYSVAPRRIVVLLDMGSMSRPSSKWVLAKEAVADLLAETPATMPVAMVTFSTEVRDVFDFGQGRTAIAAWLKQGSPPKIKSPRSTALFDATLHALKLLKPFRPGDALYAITDGADDASHAGRTRTQKVLAESGVRLFALSFFELIFGDSDPGITADNYYSFQRMIDNSGGVGFCLTGSTIVAPATAWYDDPRSREALKVSTRELNDQVQGFWMLEFAAPRSSKNKRVNIEMVDNRGSVRKDAVLNYPRMLSPIN